MLSLKQFWETCNPKFSHLTQNFSWPGSREISCLELDWSAKTVLDFGCGAGWLGLWLFENTTIEKYIAVDISNRQIESAKHQLQKYGSRCQFLELPQLFLPKADIAVCLAVIYHLPDKKSFDNTMTLLLSTDADSLLLQWRTNWQDKLLFTGKGISVTGLKRACYASPEAILEHLPGYKLSKLFGPAAKPKHNPKARDYNSYYGIFEKNNTK